MKPSVPISPNRAGLSARKAPNSTANVTGGDRREHAALQVQRRPEHVAVAQRAEPERVHVVRQRRCRRRCRAAGRRTSRGDAGRSGAARRRRMGEVDGVRGRSIDHGTSDAPWADGSTRRSARSDGGRRTAQAYFAFAGRGSDRASRRGAPESARRATAAITSASVPAASASGSWPLTPNSRDWSSGRRRARAGRPIASPAATCTSAVPQHLSEHVSAGRADGHADADFARPRRRRRPVVTPYRPRHASSSAISAKRDRQPGDQPLEAERAGQLRRPSTGRRGP